MNKNKLFYSLLLVGLSLGGNAYGMKKKNLYLSFCTGMYSPNPIRTEDGKKVSQACPLSIKIVKPQGTRLANDDSGVMWPLTQLQGYNVVEVDLSGSNIQGEALFYLVRNFPNLRTVNITNCKNVNDLTYYEICRHRKGHNKTRQKKIYVIENRDRTCFNFSGAEIDSDQKLQLICEKVVPFISQKSSESIDLVDLSRSTINDRRLHLFIKNVIKQGQFPIRKIDLSNCKRITDNILQVFKCYLHANRLRLDLRGTWVTESCIHDLRCLGMTIIS